MKATMRVLLAAAAIGTGAGHAAEMTVCVADAGIKNNVLYLGVMATTQTRLICEIDKPNYRPTLRDLYQEGWRLVQVVGADWALAQGQNARSPLYYLERTGAASEAGAPPPAAAAPPEPTEKKNKPFSLF
jgi:hypothetical protein